MQTDAKRPSGDDEARASDGYLTPTTRNNTYATPTLMHAHNNQTNHAYVKLSANHGYDNNAHLTVTDKPGKNTHTSVLLPTEPRQHNSVKKIDKPKPHLNSQSEPYDYISSPNTCYEQATLPTIGVSDALGGGRDIHVIGRNRRQRPCLWSDIVLSFVLSVTVHTEV